MTKTMEICLQINEFIYEKVTSLKWFFIYIEIQVKTKRGQYLGDNFTDAASQKSFKNESKF